MGKRPAPISWLFEQYSGVRESGEFSECPPIGADARLRCRSEYRRAMCDHTTEPAGIGCYSTRLAGSNLKCQTGGMKARLLAQPFAEGTNLIDFFTEVAAEKSYCRLRVVVAWAKRSGLKHAEPHLAAIRARGGNLELVVGISEGGATQQGLERSLELFDSVRVVYDVSGRTFHPKIYLADGCDRAMVLIGSNNLTAGGFYFNYEAGAILDLDLTDESDLAFFGAIEQLIDDLVTDTQICVELTDDSLAVLLSDGRYHIQDEDTNRHSLQAGAPEDLDTFSDDVARKADDQKSPPLFGTSQTPKKRSVPLPDSGATAPTVSSPPKPTTSQATPSPPQPAATVVRPWFKKMSNSDAQQKGNANTQLTGNLKLAKAGLPIDHTTFFRDDFFGSCNWAGTQKAKGLKEEAVVLFNVVIDGNDVDEISLKVDHAEYRIASQRNVPTWLHWGRELGEYLQNNNRVNDYVTLEKTSNGQYTITISNNCLGGFV